MLWRWRSSQVKDSQSLLSSEHQGSRKEKGQTRFGSISECIPYESHFRTVSGIMFRYNGRKIQDLSPEILRSFEEFSPIQILKS